VAITRDTKPAFGEKATSSFQVREGCIGVASWEILGEGRLRGIRCRESDLVDCRLSGSIHMSARRVRGLKVFP
jgi:hypothetical protein